MSKNPNVFVIYDLENCDLFRISDFVLRIFNPIHVYLRHWKQRNCQA